MSTRSSGNRFQLWCSDWLKSKGYIIHNQTPSGRLLTVRDRATGSLKKIWVSGRNDIFGAFDIIARNSKQVLWIQCTEDQSLKRKVEKIAAVEGLLNHQRHEWYMVWLKRKPGEVDVYQVPMGQDPRLLGKILRGKFMSSEGFYFEF